MTSLGTDLISVVNKLQALTQRGVGLKKLDLPVIVSNSSAMRGRKHELSANVCLRLWSDRNRPASLR